MTTFRQEVVYNENVYTDVKALIYFGKSYLKIPRVIIERMSSSNNSERMIGIVHWLLFCFCNYADGYVSIKGKQEVCHRGECIITYEKLARLMMVDSRSVRRYVHSLEKESLIEVKRVANCSCFRVCGYNCFTASDVPAEIPQESKRTRVTKKTVEPDAIAARRVEAELKISHGNVPRTDLLKNCCEYGKECN